MGKIPTPNRIGSAHFFAYCFPIQTDRFTTLFQDICMLTGRSYFQYICMYVCMQSLVILKPQNIGFQAMTGRRPYFCTVSPSRLFIQPACVVILILHNVLHCYICNGTNVLFLNFRNVCVFVRRRLGALIFWYRREAGWKMLAVVLKRLELVW